MNLDKVNVVDDFYFCHCCNSLRDSKHKRISKKYCMGCKNTVKTKTIVVRDKVLYGQFCKNCYKELEIIGVI